MSLTYNNLNEVKSFDVIFVGHLASVVANMFAIQTKNFYKSLVLSKASYLTIETQKQLLEPSLIPVSIQHIKITKRIKQSSVFRKQIKTIHIKPVSKHVQLDGGDIYDYKYLVYTGNAEDWNDFQSIKTLQEALSNDYSLVYSNAKKRDISSACKKVSSGNVVFYIPNGNHSGYDNLNFLSVCQQIRENLESQEQNYSKPLTFKVILEGTSFFPYCPEADQLLKKQIRERGIELSFSCKLTKIDYLRRTLTINDLHDIPYNFLYCIIPQKVPDMLRNAQINPYQNNHKTLINKRFKSIFVFGADIFPTTHSFEAIQYQSRVISQNLTHLLNQSGQITYYNGHTRIPIYLNYNEVVTVTHYFSHGNDELMGKEDQTLEINKSCSWLASLSNKVTQSFLTQAYYNYRSHGSPYYIFSPTLKHAKLTQQEKINFTEEAIKISGRQLPKMNDEEFEDKMNRTAEKHKNLPKYTKV